MHAPKAYNIELEELIDGRSKGWADIQKKKMFGGVCWLLKGNMAFGIWQDSLIVRMGRDAAAMSLQGKHVRPFDITGKPMAGWVLVEAAGWKSPAGLEKWLAAGKAFALSLPQKQGKAKARKKKTLREYQR